MSATPNPSKLLLPYQKRWAADDSRWKMGLMARQTGKDYSSGFEGIHDIVQAEKDGKKKDWLIAAPSERQSLESLQKWKDWAAIFKMAIADALDVREGKGPETLLKSSTITFPGGSRVIAVPGKPDTVRGYSANVLLTEFAFFENPDLTWRAIIPSITNSLRGGVKKVRLITTPNGIGNKAHEIWSKNYAVEQASGLSHSASGRIAGSEEWRAGTPAATGGTPVPQHKWSCHFVDIYTAVKEGLPVDPEELKSALNDPEGWAQEFECQFLDAQSVLLPYELIATCESVEATSALPAEFWQTSAPWPIDMGIDFGRTRDLTVAWSNAAFGDVAQTIEVLELSKMSTPDQVAVLTPRLARARRVCVDYSGPGVGLGDLLVEKFQKWNPDKHLYGKVELCTFSNTLKVQLFSKLRMAFEMRGLRIPVSRVIREDLHSMSRVSTPTGQITYKAPHTAAGHADRCTALALAVRAGGDHAAAFAFQSLGSGLRKGLRLREGVLA